MAREDAPGDKRLVAYVVPADAAGDGGASCARFLDTTLPRVHGAVGLRRARRAAADAQRQGRPQGPARPERSAARAGAAPSSRRARRVEEVLAGIWAEVLGLEQVGIHDNFFELGGHSLLATQVALAHPRRLRVELPLRELFAFPTVAEPGAQAGGRRAAASPGRAAPPLAALPREGALPLSFAQQRLWFLDQLEPGSAALQHPRGRPARGRARRWRRWSGAFDELLRRHEALRTTFQADGRAARAGHLPCARAARWRCVDLGRAARGGREAEARAAGGRGGAAALRPRAAARVLRVVPAAAGARRSTCCC